MSAVLEAAPPTQAQKRLTPVQYVDALPMEDQEDILIHLLKLLRKENDGAAVIPVETADEKLGYFLTPDGMQAYFDAYGPKLSAEDRQELRHRMANPGRWLTTGQLLAELDAEERGRIQSDMTHLSGSVTTEEVTEWLRQENAVPAATVVETSNC